MRLRASAVRKRSALLFHWDYRDGFTRRGVPVMTDGREGTFTRASTKTAVDSNGRAYTVPTGQPALHHQYSSGVWAPVGVLLERAGTNVCLQSQNFGTTWTLQNTPTRTAQAARCGTVYLDLIGDDSAATVEGYYQPITFTGDAVKAISFYVREGSSTSTQFVLNDATATTNRLVGVITWSAGAPVITMATGTHLLSERLQDAAGNRVTRLWFQTTSVTAANTNNLIFYPAQTAAGDVTLQGTVYIGGVQVEDALIPSSYIPTTTIAVTRAADFMEFPALWLPRDLTIYTDHTDLGTFQTSGAVLLNLGQDGAAGVFANAYITTDNPATGDVWVTYGHTVPSSTAVNVGLTGGDVSLGDQQEVRFAVLAAGIYAGRSISGAAENLTTVGAALAHDSTYHEPRLCFTPGTGAGNDFLAAHAMRSVKIAIGERTMAQMREAV